MSILARLALLFVLVPLLELFILIRLGGAIGLFSTLTLCVLTGVAGAWLARREGLRALWSFQARLAKGGLPGRSLMDGCAYWSAAPFCSPQACSRTCSASPCCCPRADAGFRSVCSAESRAGLPTDPYG